MISRLTGRLLELDTESGSILLDVGGVGYEIEVASSVFAASPQTDAELTVHTHFVVREDAQLLFGFATKAERDLFRAFIKINGVGPKLGLALISSVDPGTLARAVANNETGVLTRVPGVGKKTAERLMVELKSRLDTLKNLPGAAAAEPVAVLHGAGAIADEAENALIALGYRPQDATRAVALVLDELGAADTEPSVEELVRQALRSFARLNAGARA